MATVERLQSCGIMAGKAQEIAIRRSHAHI
jgi:hypothetical protein